MDDTGHIPAPGDRPRRRPQAERTAETRSRLIEAAITCLNTMGYSATTVSDVAANAGVSRGAMTHHFPAKTDLMLAVVSAVFADDAELYNRSIPSLDPAAWLLALPETMWSVISRSAGIAVMEIMLASRSDVALADRLRTLQTVIDDRAHRWSAHRMAAAGVAVHPDADAIHQLYVAAVRGLALQSVFSNNVESVHGSLRVLSEMMRRLYPELDHAVTS